jgi:hypothetical protein
VAAHALDFWIAVLDLTTEQEQRVLALLAELAS